MNKKKKIVRLVSTASPHFYTVGITRNSDKLSLKKYDPVVRQHVLYKQSKRKLK